MVKIPENIVEAEDNDDEFMRLAQERQIALMAAIAAQTDERLKQRLEEQKLAARAALKYLTREPSAHSLATSLSHAKKGFIDLDEVRCALVTGLKLESQALTFKANFIQPGGDQGHYDRWSKAYSHFADALMTHETVNVEFLKGGIVTVDGKAQ